MLKKMKGFTLAETLVTLGVLGVVAAMIIPTLLGFYYKKQCAIQLKNQYAMFTQGIKLYMAQQGAQILEETQLFMGAINDSDLTDKQKQELKKAFKTTTVLNGNEIADSINIFYSEHLRPLNNNIDIRSDWGNIHRITLLDGSIIYLKFNAQNAADKSFVLTNGGKMTSKVATIYIDVNGRTKPNALGRDLFAFELASNGYLVPQKGREDHLFGGNLIAQNEYTNNCNDSDDTNYWGCAARIIEHDDWEMKY